MKEMTFFVNIIAVATIVSIIPAYSAPIVGERINAQTYSLLQEVSKEDDSLDSLLRSDIELFSPVYNEIASIISSKLARDPDPTTLEAARKFIDKAKAFIEPVVKSVIPNNRDSKGFVDLVRKIFSSLREMIGSDDEYLNAQLARAIMLDMLKNTN